MHRALLTDRMAGEDEASAIRCQDFGRHPVEGLVLIRACIKKFREPVTVSDLCRRHQSCYARQHVGKSNKPAPSCDQGEKGPDYWRAQSESFRLCPSWKIAKAGRSFSRCNKIDFYATRLILTERRSKKSVCTFPWWIAFLKRLLPSLSVSSVLLE